MRETDYSALGERAVQICQDLIRIPSVNNGGGDGDERAAADYVFDFLKKCGLEPIRYQSAPTRVSVVARVKGRNSARSGLVVHGHLDTCQLMLKIGKTILGRARLSTAKFGVVAPLI